MDKSTVVTSLLTLSASEISFPFGELGHSNTLVYVPFNEDFSGKDRDEIDEVKICLVSSAKAFAVWSAADKSSPAGSVFFFGRCPLSQDRHVMSSL